MELVQEYLESLPSRTHFDSLSSQERGEGKKVYMQNGSPYPSPYDYSIYTDYLKALHSVIPR
jgi:hypothetical protein